MKTNVVINISGLGYIVIGLFMFLLMGDYTVFTWADPWLYVYMIFWPLVLIWNIFLWLLLFAVIIGAILLFGCLFDNKR